MPFTKISLIDKKIKMEDKNFNLSPQLIWVLAILSLVLFLVKLIFNVQNIEFPQIVSSFNSGVFFVVWLVLVVEILTTKIYNQKFWLISMFILPPITVIFYMIQRQRLKHLAQSFNKKYF